MVSCNLEQPSLLTTDLHFVALHFLLITSSRGHGKNAKYFSHFLSVDAEPASNIDLRKSPVCMTFTCNFFFSSIGHKISNEPRSGLFSCTVSFPLNTSRISALGYVRVSRAEKKYTEKTGISKSCYSIFHLT